MALNTATNRPDLPTTSISGKNHESTAGQVTSSGVHAAGVKRSSSKPAIGSPGLSDITPEIFAQFPAEQQEAIRERAEAVGWLARTVADAAPGLRAARYQDALEQARAMGIPVDNLPPAYHADLDPLLRQYGDEAQSFLDQLGDRGAK